MMQLLYRAFLEAAILSPPEQDVFAMKTSQTTERFVRVQSNRSYQQIGGR
jgi:hypothetical protein